MRESHIKTHQTPSEGVKRALFAYLLGTSADRWQQQRISLCAFGSASEWSAHKRCQFFLLSSNNFALHSLLLVHSWSKDFTTSMPRSYKDKLCTFLPASKRHSSGAQSLGYRSLFLQKLQALPVALSSLLSGTISGIASYSFCSVLVNRVHQNSPQRMTPVGWGDAWKRAHHERTVVKKGEISLEAKTVLRTRP